MSEWSGVSRPARFATAGLGLVVLWACCQSSRDNGRDGGVAGAAGEAGVGGAAVADGGASGGLAIGGSAAGSGGIVGSGGVAGGGAAGAAGRSNECPRAYVAPGGAIGSAGACGATGQPCCPDRAEGVCEGSNTFDRFCDWSSGAPICLDCGGINQPCCWLINTALPRKAYCRSGAGACDATTYPGICTDTCGRPWESCCPGMNCLLTCTCNFSSSCASCGDPDCLSSSRCVCPA